MISFCRLRARIHLPRNRCPEWSNTGVGVWLLLEQIPKRQTSTWRRLCQIRFFLNHGLFGDVWLTAWGSMNPGLTLYEGPVEFQWKLTRLLVGYFTCPQSQYLPWVSIAFYVRLGVHRYTAFQTHSTMIHWINPYSWWSSPNFAGRTIWSPFSSSLNPIFCWSTPCFG